MTVRPGKPVEVADKLVAELLARERAGEFDETEYARGSTSFEVIWSWVRKSRLTSSNQIRGVLEELGDNGEPCCRRLCSTGLFQLVLTRALFASYSAIAPGTPGAGPFRGGRAGGVKTQSFLQSKAWRTLRLMALRRDASVASNATLTSADPSKPGRPHQAAQLAPASGAHSLEPAHALHLCDNQAHREKAAHRTGEREERIVIRASIATVTRSTQTGTDTQDTHANPRRPLGSRKAAPVVIAGTFGQRPEPPPD